MNEILAVYPDMKIELYAPTRKKRLTYEMMEAFIRIMPDAEKNFAAYTRVRKMSVAYKSPYKFVEDWFAKQFPYYGEFFVEENGEAKQGFFHAISFKYLYTVGLLIPHTRASSDTFIFPSRKAA